MGTPSKFSQEEIEHEVTIIINIIRSKNWEGQRNILSAYLTLVHNLATGLHDSFKQRHYFTIIRSQQSLHGINITIF